MKKRLKKILTTSIIGAISATAIGCSSNGNMVAKNIDKSMADFVSSINNLDYVETNSPSQKNIGKIVETSSNENTTGYLNGTINHVDVENAITKPSDRTDNFKLFILSDTPFISLTSDDNSSSLNLNIKFSTNKIEETSCEINEQINKLILKRSILMIYVNEIYNGNVILSEENKTAINAYVNVIKENTSFLNGNRGMVKNQLNLASNLVENESNNNLINYYMIKSGEALETRSNKIDSTISAIDSIINIIENNLTSGSPYYQSNLNGTYDNLISNMDTLKNKDDGSNAALANSIAESLDFKSCDSTNPSNHQTIANESSKTISENTQIKTLEETNQKNSVTSNDNLLNNNQTQINNNNSRNISQEKNSSRRTTRRIHRRRNQTNTQPSTIDETNNQNSRNIMENDINSKTSRTLENRIHEDYTSSTSSPNHATRVPHGSIGTHQINPD